MARLKWDQTGERFFETGVDHGVLYLRDEEGEYTAGVPWNGLVSVTESPSGAEATPQYADNMKYLNLVSAEEFAATVEAFTYPSEFGECDGTVSPVPGLYVGQQRRRTFGLCYRTLKGNDVEDTGLGYILHLVYGALAAPSEKQYSTVNDTPEAMTFSWEMSTSPVEVETLPKPTAILTVDSTELPADKMAALEALLYGGTDTEATLPHPDEIISLLAAA